MSDFDSTPFHILNLGAGVQSTCLYLMSLHRDEPDHVPRFDYAIFADTGNEPRAVYAHLEWLKSLDGPPILVRQFGDIAHDLIHGHHKVVRRLGTKFRAGEEVDQCFSLPAFTLAEKPGGKIEHGQLTRRCTREYKIAVVERAIREDVIGLQRGQRFPDGVTVHQYFGLSYDEPGRVVRSKANARGLSWFNPHYPLFDIEMTRGDCEIYNRGKVPHPVPRSACLICPYRSDAEWVTMKRDSPEEFERACQVDDALRRPGAAVARDLDATLYLHASRTPLRDVDFQPPRTGKRYTVEMGECEGFCGN
jgi:hypothetical protein